MINFDFNNDCTGCSACADSCSKHCITMDKNKYGFVVPYINVEACNDCKKCEKVCPVLNTKIASSSTPQLYSAYNVDIEERKAGSSGSIMLVLARYILKLDGVVYGAAFDEKLKLCHTRATTLDEVYLQMKSKYLQSATVGVYRKVRKDLREGRFVLFVGTPCQCQALNNFLGKERTDKLLLVDFICHGVPSQELFDKSIAHYELHEKCKIVKFSFRQKGKDNLHNYYLQVIKNGKLEVKQGEAHTFPFYCGYLKYIAFRESCYKCKFVGQRRITDFTLGDFWGLQKVMPALNFNKGISMMLVNSSLGSLTFNKIKKEISYETYNLDSPIAKNHAYLKATRKSILHSLFMHDYLSLPYDKLEKRYFMWNKRSINWIIYAIIKKIGI